LEWWGTNTDKSTEVDEQEFEYNIKPFDNNTSALTTELQEVMQILQIFGVLQVNAPLHNVGDVAVTAAKNVTHVDGGTSYRVYSRNWGDE
jgi:hypothetical protein